MGYLQGFMKRKYWKKRKAKSLCTEETNTMMSTIPYY